MSKTNTKLEKLSRHLGRVLGEKYASAWIWKKTGKTYRQIAEKLGVSEARVYQLLCLANDEAEYNGKPLSRLRPRYRQVLINAGYDTDQSVIDGIIHGQVHHRPSAGMKGFSVKGFKEAGERYNVKPMRRQYVRVVSEKTIRKYTEVLERNGYVVKKSENSKNPFSHMQH